MDLGISGKTAIVTGGAMGIGRAIAEEFAQNGMRVVIVDRSAESLGATAKQIASQFKTEVLPMVGNVADPPEPARVVASAFERFGSVDVLVNNAGRAHAGGILDASDADWQEMTETKLSAMRRFCQAVVPHMRKRHWGRIINISSIGGIYPNYKLMVSHALSAAVNNLTRSIALELAHDGILVNAIGVGAVLTDNWARNMLPDVRKRRPELTSKSDAELTKLVGEEMTPVGRFGRPDEIAAIAAFLASERNGFVTGGTIEASGGADRFM